MILFSPFQIDESVLVVMTAESDQLKRYLPSYGHRIAAVTFVTRKLREEQLDKKTLSKKDLIDRLQSNTSEHERKAREPER